MAVRVSAESGFDAAYMLKGQAERTAPERTAGGYYINAAQAGEAPRLPGKARGTAERDDP